MTWCGLRSVVFGECGLLGRGFFLGCLFILEKDLVCRVVGGRILGVSVLVLVVKVSVVFFF